MVQKDSIKILSIRLKNCNDQITQNLNKIDELDKRIATFVPKDRTQYKEFKIFIRNLIKFVVANNILLSKRTSYEYQIARLLTIKNSNDANNLVAYLKQIETINAKYNDELFPYELTRINKINAITKRLYIKQLKLLYLSNPSLHAKNIVNKLKLKVQFAKLKYDIASYKEYLKDVKTSFCNQYVAKLIHKIEEKVKLMPKSIRSKHLISLQNMMKYYGNNKICFKVLSDVNLTIDKGEFVVIIGPSGSGKTTLLNIISGMDTATYGQTIVNNHNLITFNSNELTMFRRDNIGYVFQQYGLLPNLTVKENVEIGAYLQKDKDKQVDINDLLKTIGIYEYRNKFPRELSGGQQQRVSIARSVAKNPSIIFGDEPTGAVDEEMSKQIMQLFVDVNKKFKTTIIIVTHNHILTELATKVIRVADGHIKSIDENLTPKAVQDLSWSK